MASDPSSPTIVKSSPLHDPFVDHRARSSSASTGGMMTISASPLSVASAPACFSERSVSSATATSSPPVGEPSSNGGVASISPAKYLELLKKHQRDFDLAQMIYPAEAIVFVGNLPASVTDLELSDALTAEFGKYGTCWVSVRRHQSPQHVKPYAYVQFSTSEDAQDCLGTSDRTSMRGRVLRIDVSNACRHVVVLHIDNSFVNDYEAYGVFGQFGPIERVHHDANTGGTVVRFRNYGSFLALQRAFDIWLAIHFTALILVVSIIWLNWDRLFPP